VTGENIIAGAGHAENVGLLVLIGIAAMAYRTSSHKTDQQTVQPSYLRSNAFA
jgi:hypothetical protein